MPAVHRLLRHRACLLTHPAADALLQIHLPSEVSDAVVVIVSEENGTISVAIGGMLKRHLAPQTLQKLLSNELIADETEKINPCEDGHRPG